MFFLSCFFRKDSTLHEKTDPVLNMILMKACYHRPEQRPKTNKHRTNRPCATQLMPVAHSLSVRRMNVAQGATDEGSSEKDDLF